MHVLVLGSTGFIGSSVLRFLTSFPQEFAITTTSLRGNADFNVDIRDRQSLRDILASHCFDVILNASGRVSHESESKIGKSVNFDVNVTGVLNLIDAVQGMTGGCKPFVIHLASALEPRSKIDSAESSYAQEKQIGTEIFKRSLSSKVLSGACLRIHNVYGPGQPESRFIANCIKTFLDSGCITLNYPNRIRDFAYVEDVAMSIVAMIRECRYREKSIRLEYEVGTAKGVSLSSVASTLATLLGLEPEKVVRAALPPLLDCNPRVVADVQKLFQKSCQTDINSGLRKMLEELK